MTMDFLLQWWPKSSNCAEFHNELKLKFARWKKFEEEHEISSYMEKGKQLFWNIGERGKFTSYTAQA
jgi:hypothetical protein